MARGYLDAGEYPHDGCARELGEEFGLTITPGRLLLVDFAPSTEHRRRALISMLFDCGDLPRNATIRLQESELSVWAFFTADDAAERLPVTERHRVTAALDARRANSTAYLR